MSRGEHTLTFVYEDGETSTNFKIKAADDTNLSDNNLGGESNSDDNPDTVAFPQTGDSGNPALRFALLLLSDGAIATSIVSRKRMRNR